VAFAEAEAEVKDALAEHQRAKELITSGEYSDAIVSTHRCMERAVKSLHKLVGLEAPKTIETGLVDDTDAIIHVLRRLKFPREHEFSRQQLLRIRWILSMWSWSSDIAVYSYEELPASIFFRKEDAQLATSYAEMMMVHIHMVISYCRNGDIKIIGA
jgi:HEPN domain-containing protein